MASFAPTLTLTIDRSQGHALVRVIEEGVDELSCYTGAPAGDGALEDAADSNSSTSYTWSSSYATS